MTKINKSVIYPICIIFIALTGCREKEINVSDNFDQPGLSRIWNTDRMEKQSFEIQSKVVHNGSGAAKITLRTGDMHEDGIGKDKPTDIRQGNLQSPCKPETTAVTYMKPVMK